MGENSFKNFKLFFLSSLYIIFSISFIFFSLSICVHLGNTVVLDFLKTSFLFRYLDDFWLLTVKEIIVISTYMGMCLFIFDKYPKEFIRQYTTKILKTYDKYIFYNSIRTVKEYEQLDELEIYEDKKMENGIEDEIELSR